MYRTGSELSLRVLPDPETLQTICAVRTEAGLVPSAIWLARARASLDTCPAHPLWLLAKDPACPPDALAALSCNFDIQIRVFVAENPNIPTPPYDLWRLARDPDWEVRMRMAAGPALREDEYQRLSYDRDARVRDALLVNPAIPGDLASDLWERAAKKDTTTWGNEHRALSENPALPLELLQQAAQHKLCVTGVARNPSTPVSLLRALWQGTHSAWSDTGLSINPNTPGDILTRIYETKPGVRDRVLANPSCPLALIDEATHFICYTDDGAEHPETAVALAGNPSLPPERAVDLWNAYHAARQTLVVSPWCPGLLLSSVIGGTNKTLHAPVAGNPSLCRSDLGVLTRDHDLAVRQLAQAHPHIDNGWLLGVPAAELFGNGHLRSEQLEDLEVDRADMVVGLANGWNGSYGALLDASVMLSV